MNLTKEQQQSLLNHLSDYIMLIEYIYPTEKDDPLLLKAKKLREECRKALQQVTGL